MALMRIEWTLNRKQVAWLALYATILPASMLTTSVLGYWLFLVGALVSLPFAPFGFLAFWWGSLNGSVFLAFVATWLVVFFLGWLALAHYVRHRTRRASTNESSPVTYGAKLIWSWIIIIVLASFAMWAIWVAVPYRVA